MMPRTFYPTLVFLFGFCLLVNGQDARFSQYYAAPTYFNPALTGAYEGAFRLTGIYRDQWRGALDNPYVTYSVSGDVRFDVGPKVGNRDAVAGGVLFMRDQVDVIDFSTTFIALTGAFHKSLNSRKNSFLSFGLRFGISQKNINYEHINFQDQFDGVDQYPLATNEVLPRNNFSFPDLSLGIHYTVSPDKTSQFSVGAGIDHIIPVDVSFFQEIDDPTTTFDYPENPIFTRYSADASYKFSVGAREASLRPRMAVNLQGPFQEVTLGSTFKRRIGELVGNNIQIGAFLRGNNFLDSFQPSAIVGLVGFELQDVLLGISYDMNITGSSFANRNAFEFSVIYIDDYVNDSYLCPTF
jgi:type IX secretion system PorP/SprF family membrane protein